MSPVLSPQTLHREAGVELVGVDAELDQPADWSGLLKPDNAHLILNLEGDGIVLGRTIRLGIAPGTASVIRPDAQERLLASRLPGVRRQRFLIFSATFAWISTNFGASVAALHPALRHEEAPAGQMGQIRSMNLAERDLCELLLRAPVPRDLRPTWFRAKSLECFSLFGSAPASPRNGNDPIRQRIEASILWLREHLTEDLDLQHLARHVGCAPHYLSRLFKQQTGFTLSRKLREIRIDRAAQLLREGLNVTEAAFEVGYNSLSHFTKAFLAEKGVRPSDWKAGGESSAAH